LRHVRAVGFRYRNRGVADRPLLRDHYVLPFTRFR
jgi:hypothetical protein